MAAATTVALQQWNAGPLSDNAFWKQCWLDPPDASKVRTKLRERQSQWSKLQ